MYQKILLLQPTAYYWPATTSTVRTVSLSSSMRFDAMTPKISTYTYIRTHTKTLPTVSRFQRLYVHTFHVCIMKCISWYKRVYWYISHVCICIREKDPSLEAIETERKRRREKSRKERDALRYVTDIILASHCEHCRIKNCRIKIAAYLYFSVSASSEGYGYEIARHRRQLSAKAREGSEVEHPARRSVPPLHDTTFGWYLYFYFLRCVTVATIASIDACGSPVPGQPQTGGNMGRTPRIKSTMTTTAARACKT